ncbi:DUF1266 domain-containing protein [Thaumasiovibrio subtropicus]|uniref:DUF1266 domain-containing protein n=1 Tax=Thaumasiovibrio subtropicus TaxID=1891207 RepID=UPI000B3549B6|nr:DUF1266 domain-containing protein [Thaumasiovibrio subtropicus]
MSFDPLSFDTSRQHIRWCLTLSGPLHYQHFSTEFSDINPYDGSDFTPEQARGSLREQIRVETEPEFKAFVFDACRNGIDKEPLLNVIDQCACTRPSEWSETLKTAESHTHRIELEYAALVWHMVQHKKFKAWDFARLVMFTRQAHYASIITNKEAEYYLLYVGHIAQTTFSSWKEYLISYTLGEHWFSYQEGLCDAEALTESDMVIDYSSDRLGKSSRFNLHLNDIPWHTPLPEVNSQSWLLTPQVVDKEIK